jgi:hypothetical protein
MAASPKTTHWSHAPVELIVVASAGVLAACASDAPVMWLTADLTTLACFAFAYAWLCLTCRERAARLHPLSTDTLHPKAPALRAALGGWLPSSLHATLCSLLFATALVLGGGWDLLLSPSYADGDDSLHHALCQHSAGYLLADWLVDRDPTYTPHHLSLVIYHVLITAARRAAPPGAIKVVGASLMLGFMELGNAPLHWSKVLRAAATDETLTSLSPTTKSQLLLVHKLLDRPFSAVAWFRPAVGWWVATRLISVLYLPTLLIIDVPEGSWLGQAAVIVTLLTVIASNVEAVRSRGTHHRPRPWTPEDAHTPSSLASALVLLYGLVSLYLNHSIGNYLLVLTVPLVVYWLTTYAEDAFSQLLESATTPIYHVRLLPWKSWQHGKGVFSVVSPTGVSETSVAFSDDDASFAVSK